MRAVGDFGRGQEKILDVTWNVPHIVKVPMKVRCLTNGANF